MPNLTKSNVSHLKDENTTPGKLRRLASASSLAKALGRRQPSSKENVPTTHGPQQAMPNMMSSKPSQPLADMPPPTLNQRRPRRVSSPHPKKEILPRSVTLSNLPVPKSRLPSSKSSVSLLNRAPAPSASPPTVTKKTIVVKPASTDKRRSLIPTPTAGQSSRASNTSPKTRNTQGEEIKVRPKAATPVEISLPEPYTATPLKLRHKQSKSPERKPAEVAPTSQKSKRLHSSHDIVHHGLMKTISPPALPPPKVDESSGQRRSLSRPVASASSQIADTPFVEEASTPSARLMRLKASLQGQLLEPSLEEVLWHDENTDLEAQDEDNLVRQAEPFAYWTGRFISLNDKLMNETMDTPKPSVKGGTQLMQSMEEQRAKRVLDYLEKVCLTPEARKSLWQFRTHLATIKGFSVLLMSHRNDHINGIGASGRSSPTSSAFSSERNSLDVLPLGMPKGPRLPKGPTWVEPKRSHASSFGSSYASSTGSWRPLHPLIPRPLAIPPKMNIGPVPNQKSAGSSPKSPDSAVGSTASMMPSPLEEKDQKRLSFVQRLIGRSRGSSNDSGSSAVYEGT